MSFALIDLVNRCDTLEMGEIKEGEDMRRKIGILGVYWATNICCTFCGDADLTVEYTSLAFRASSRDINLETLTFG